MFFLGKRALLVVLGVLFLAFGANAVTLLDSGGSVSVDVNSPVEDSVACAPVDTNFTISINGILKDSTQTVDRNVHMTFNGFDVNRSQTPGTWLDYNATADSNSRTLIYHTDGNIQIAAGQTGMTLSIDLNNVNTTINPAGDIYDLNVYLLSAGTAGGFRDGNWGHIPIYIRPTVTKAGWRVRGGADNNSFCTVRGYSSVSNAIFDNNSVTITFLGAVDLSGNNNYDSFIPVARSGSDPKLQLSGASIFSSARAKVEFASARIQNPEVFRNGNACSPLCNVPTVSPLKAVSFTTERLGDTAIYDLEESATGRATGFIPAVPISPSAPFQTIPSNVPARNPVVDFVSGIMGAISGFLSALFGR
ncbi:MAG: hypothetical protein UX13_C0006G0013 [Candidatus Woesebacteria bacterium GW2011_GWB1_45_5]|uniref:Uncharacterized protein n=1 Tax=Candidatus Woesebacteria bacterium GW2011_GWB1_45_5 TaxID=1618581 RepID=A0A0G1MRC2_9BACT|nr:MAG: hypothetical protein UX13_C0006G0013 [Candidatus Woesebacteria bacterium GW2011_GWB1_45_5]